MSDHIFERLSQRAEAVCQAWGTGASNDQLGELISQLHDVVEVLACQPDALAFVSVPEDESGYTAEEVNAIIDQANDLLARMGGDIGSIYQRLQMAGDGARAERDIMRAAVEAIATGNGDAIAIAQQALDADRQRREDNLTALRSGA